MLVLIQIIIVIVIIIIINANYQLLLNDILIKGDWVKIFEDDVKLRRKSLTIRRHKIEIKLQHFTKFSASAPGATDREILTFLNPAKVENNDAVYITVYAVPRHVVQVSAGI